MTGKSLSSNFWRSATFDSLCMISLLSFFGHSGDVGGGGGKEARARFKPLHPKKEAPVSLAHSRLCPFSCSLLFGCDREEELEKSTVLKRDAGNKQAISYHVSTQAYFFSLTSNVVSLLLLYHHCGEEGGARGAIPPLPFCCSGFLQCGMWNMAMEKNNRMRNWKIFSLRRGSQKITHNFFWHGGSWMSCGGKNPQLKRLPCLFQRGIVQKRWQIY